MLLQAELEFLFGLKSYGYDLSFCCFLIAALEEWSSRLPKQLILMVYFNSVCLVCFIFVKGVVNWCCGENEVYE